MSRKRTHKAAGPRPAIGAASRARVGRIGGALLVLGAGMVVAFLLYARSSGWWVPGPPKGGESVPAAAIAIPATNNPTGDAALALDARPEIPTDPLELLRIGNEFLDQGQPGRAIPYYHRAQKLNDQDEEVHFNLGYAYAKISRTNEAMFHYQESLRIYPDYIEAHNNLGNLYVSLGQYDKATEHFSRALTLMPDHASALNNLGKCLAAQGKIGEAIIQLSQAVRVNPEYFEARYNLGQAFLMRESYEEAMTEFNEALRLSPGFRPAAIGLARAQALRAAKP